MTPLRRKRIFLMCFSLGLILATLVLFLVEYATAPPFPSPAGARSDVSLSHFRHTATEKDRILWTLAADRADYSREDGMAELTGVTASYITADNTPIVARSLSGHVDTRTMDIALSGEVRATHQEYLLETSELLYVSAAKTLTAPRPARLTGPGIQVASEAADYDLSSGRLRFTGKVKGILHAPQP